MLGFVGAKGVGTTTVALNVVVLLAARKKSVVIVELQPGSGSLAHHLVGTMIVNRMIYPQSLELSKIQSQLGCDLIGSILSDATACLNAQECGLSIVLASPQHEISLNLVDIVDRLAAENVAVLSI